VFKVNHYNTFPHGGAALAARRIHSGIATQRTPWESRFYYAIDEAETLLDETCQRLDFVSPVRPRSLNSLLRDRLWEKPRQRRLIREYETHLRDRPADQETFSAAEQIQTTCLNWARDWADVVHLHWIAYLADYPSFFASIPEPIPLVWTLHDMNPFTGGCHYARDCSRFHQGCGDCPQVNAPNKNDVSRSSFLAKQKSLRHRKIAVVSPSDWLRNLAERSSVWPEGTTFHTIRYGLELDQYYPVDKQSARQQLGLKDDHCLIAFGAEQITNPRKGFQFLAEALLQLNALVQLQDQPSDWAGSRGTTIPAALVFGSGNVTLDSGIPVHKLGYLKTAAEKRTVYSAADMVIVPSLDDNQPQVALEAMACGTPVIGLRSGGIPEIVRPGVTGLLVEKGESLAGKMAELLEFPSLRRKLGEQARSWMAEEFELARQSAKYLDLYDQIRQAK
jgi:glycosyltransferase involved in cell wall biosynthesis